MQVLDWFKNEMWIGGWVVGGAIYTVVFWDFKNITKPFVTGETYVNIRRTSVLTDAVYGMAWTVILLNVAKPYTSLIGCKGLPTYLLKCCDVIICDIYTVGVSFHVEAFLHGNVTSFENQNIDC